MRSIEKRISVIEKMLTQKKVEGAWLAFIEENDTVHLSHIKHDDIFLNSREELNEFIKLHDMGQFDLIIVDHVDMQGEPPKEL